MEPALPIQSKRNTNPTAASPSTLTCQQHRSQQAPLLPPSSSSLQRSGGAERPTPTEAALATTAPLDADVDMDGQRFMQTQKDGGGDNPDDRDVAMRDGDAVAASVEAENEKRAEASLALPPPLRIPGHLLRVLSCQSNGAMATSQQGMLVLIFHAAMLETGFATKVEKDATTATPPAGATDTTSMELSTNDWAVPEDACLPGMYRLSYCLRDASKTFTAEQQQEEDDKNWCSSTCSLIGSSILFAARASDGHSRHLLLNPAHYFRPSSPPDLKSWRLHGDAPQQVGLTPPRRASTSVAGNCLVVSSSQNQEGEHGVMHPDALRCLWNALKDTIALPMLTAVCAAIGFPPPAGLLTLPGELKSRILASLPALDVAALASVNSELRHVASDDAFWRPLFDAEFPSPLSWVIDQIPRRGYKWAFAMCWRERELRRKEMEDARRRHYHFLASPPGPHFSPAPFYPAPPPRGFPGVVGGDYDRLPFLGGTGIGGGAGGGGFGGVPGGRGMFGTGSARRQGHGLGGGGGFFYL
jgi:hypothetical protein